MLLYGTGAAFMDLDSIVNLRLFLSILLYIFVNVVLKGQIETVNGTSISKRYLLFYYENNTERTNFRIIYVICFTFV